MEDFDKQVRDLDGVYRYFRFSDDIIVFCFRNGDQIGEQIKDLLFKISPMLSLNEDKKYDVEVANRDRASAKLVNFEYLG